MTPEKQVEDQVMRFLWAIPRGMFFVVKNGGVFDAKIKRFRKPGKWFTPGVSDVLGVYRGIAISMELKSKVGKPTDEQKSFLRRYQESGGVSGVVRSIDDALELIKYADGLADRRDASLRAYLDQVDVGQDESDQCGEDEGV